MKQFKYKSDTIYEGPWDTLVFESMSQQGCLEIFDKREHLKPDGKCSRGCLKIYDKHLEYALCSLGWS